ncbi:MAG: substrate-binding domain-containing protein [Lachnospiraceae bacterium]|nr:substrate-binding domain-containing protein [Lachnospiraceae bacterium]
MINRRKRIGVLMGSAIAPYLRTVLRGMYQAAYDLGADLVVFAGSQLTYNFMDGGEIEKDHDLMNAITREHVRRNEIDGMVVVYGSHTMDMTTQEKQRLLDTYGDIPYILIEEFSDRNNTGYIINDNYSSMRKVVEHLVNYHGYTKFLYVGGWENNRESIERKRAFEDVLIENELHFEPKMMVYGLFSELCGPVVEELLDRNEKPEAIVCANDLMAYAVYDVLKKRGMRVGNPRLDASAVAVTGYDDDVRASSSDPPLTTVGQDFYYEGYKSIENVLVLLRDGIIDGGIVPTILKKRSSCGCSYGRKHRYLPMSDIERTQPEFYAVKIAELMREDILISNVKDEIGDKIYDILYESLYKDILILGGYIKDTLNAETVVGQLRELVNSPFSKYISPNAMMNAFSDYMSALIHDSADHNKMILLSEILVEGMKYLQNYVFNIENVRTIKYETETMQLSLISRNMSFVSDDEQKMFRVALEKMCFSDRSDIYIFLYDEPVMHSEGIETVHSARMRLAAKKNEAEGIVTYAFEERPVIEGGINELYFASEYEDDKSSRYCFADIHHSDKIYGVAVSRMETDDVMYLTLLALQVAMILSFRG